MIRVDEGDARELFGRLRSLVVVKGPRRSSRTTNQERDMEPQG